MWNWLKKFLGCGDNVTQTQNVGKGGFGIQSGGNMGTVTISNVECSNNGEADISIAVKGGPNLSGIKSRGGHGNGMTITPEGVVLTGQEIEIRGVRIRSKDSATVILKGDNLTIYADGPEVAYLDGVKPDDLNIFINPAKR